MPRTARKKSESGTYHVMLRGVNRQSIFEERDDCLKFVEVLALCKLVGGFELYAYCLMGNHVHMLIKPTETEPLETVFRRIGARYVGWFNRKYGRVGHLFQDRYASEAVDSDGYFLSCLRYILRNPVAAGMCVSPFDYDFSSAREYAGAAVGITDTCVAIDMVGRESLVEFVASDDDPAGARSHLDAWSVERVADSALRDVMFRTSGCADASAFQRLDPDQRALSIKALRAAGGSIKQVSRITGLSPGIVRRVQRDGS